MRNEYYAIACDDLDYLEATLHLPHYNQMSMLCEQVVEKMLKSVAECVCTNDVERVLKSHNLRAIYAAIYADYSDFSLNVRDLSYLKDFYYDSRYPGDDFVDVSKDMFAECLEIMYDVIEQVNTFRANAGLYVTEAERRTLP